MHEMAEPVAVIDRIGQRVDRAHRHADQDELIEADLVDKAADVADLRRDRIIAVRRPVGVAVAALVERDAVEIVAQRQAAQIPGMRRQRPAMQEQDRRLPLLPQSR